MGLVEDVIQIVIAGAYMGQYGADWVAYLQLGTSILFVAYSYCERLLVTAVGGTQVGPEEETTLETEVIPLGSSPPTLSLAPRSPSLPPP